MERKPYPCSRATQKTTASDREIQSEFTFTLLMNSRELPYAAGVILFHHFTLCKRIEVEPVRYYLPGREKDIRRHECKKDLVGPGVDQATDGTTYQNIVLPPTTSCYVILSVRLTDIDIHFYEIRGRESYRAQQHRSVAFQRLASQAGVKFLNRLPGGFIQLDSLNLFKALLKHLLVSNTFYSVEVVGRIKI
ncbi:hypothetical protein J6590_082560 [Homalodisca vitripennis]|nr:hypothetical protein J6590_082560 [Homalodisca vitripennis]